MADIDIKATQEQIAKLATDIQESHKKLVDEGKANSETLVKMSADFAKYSDEYQKGMAKLDAEIKAREELEIAVARIKEHGGTGQETKSNPEYMTAFRNYLFTREQIKGELEDAELKSLMGHYAGAVNISASQFQALKTLLVGSNPDGGYLVPTDRSSIISNRIFETTPIRSLATIETTSRDSKEYVIDDDQAASFMAGEVDNHDVNTATPKIGLKTIPIVEQVAQPLASQKSLDDIAWNIDSWLSGKVSDFFSRYENFMSMNGAGNKQWQGILTLADWAALGVYERDALETRSIGAMPTTGDILIDLQTDLLEYYQANARWIMHRKAWAEICKLKDLNGQYLINPMMIFSGQGTLQVLGKPVVLSGDMTASPGPGDIVLLYGDFRSGYAIIDRIGIRVLRDPYTSKGYVKFYTTKRSGAGVINFQAIKRLRIASGT